MTIRLSVDIGGTFTDVVLSEQGKLTTSKVLTTYSDRDGAVPGVHVVTVQVFPEGALPGNEFAGGEPPIPLSYSDVSTSTLTATVEAGKPNDITLELADE